MSDKFSKSDLERTLDMWQRGVSEEVHHEPGGEFDIIMTSIETEFRFKWIKYLPKWLQFKWLCRPKIVKAVKYSGCYPVTSADQLELDSIEFTSKKYQSPLIDDIAADMLKKMKMLETIEPLQSETKDGGDE